MRLKPFFRDPFVEKVLAGLVVAALLGLGALIFGGWAFIRSVWLFLWEPLELWTWVVGLLVLVFAWSIIKAIWHRWRGGAIHSDPEDIIAVLTSWIGHYHGGIGDKAINFKETDRLLRLQPGSTEKYIERAAAYYKYRRRHKGTETIMFEGGY